MAFSAEFDSEIPDVDLRVLRLCLDKTEQLTGTQWVVDGIPIHPQINRVNFAQARAAQWVIVEMDSYPPLFDGVSFTCGISQLGLSVVYATYVKGTDAEYIVVDPTLVGHFEGTGGAATERSYMIHSWSVIKDRMDRLPR